MGIWVELVGFNLLALLAGMAYGPVYAAAGTVRTWTLRILFALALGAYLLHVPGPLRWLLVLWASFGVGARIRRRLEQPQRGPAGAEDQPHP